MIASSSESVVGVMYSGGLDSAILLAKLLDEGKVVQPFHVRSDLYWQSAELLAGRRFLDAVRTPKLRSLVLLDMPLQDLYADHWSMTGAAVPDANTPDEAVFLPGRNALLFVKAAVWCQLHRVPELALATLGTSPFPDASAEFVHHFQTMINLGASFKIRITLPFSGLTKRQVMEFGRGYPLDLTFSCIAPVKEASCGRCNKCAERQQALLYLRDAAIQTRRPCTA